MNYFDYMEKHDYEQLVMFHDKTTGLKGITCIHNTTLGPALGGTRIWNYASEEEAIIDCLRLARGMSYKAAAAGLNLGGGKTVLIGEASKVKSEAYFRALGRFVQSLNGRYITAEDVNTTTKDMDFVHMETDFVVGLEGKSGDPSPMTALGVFHGIRASLEEVYGDATISKYSFAIQGVGHTGYYLMKYLLENQAKKVFYTDINPQRIKTIQKDFPQAEYVKPEDYFGLDVDVLSPCALGAQLNEKTIPSIKAKIVAGSANNLLADEDIHGPMIKERGILYAPDFVINAGGVINVSHELGTYVKERAVRDIERIYDRLKEIFSIAREQDIATSQAAKVYAKQRMAIIGAVRSNYIPR